MAEPARQRVAPEVELDAAIRTRRTHKAFAPEAVPDDMLDELLELARWVPNHHLTNPWRFRVLGPGALERLKQAAGPDAAAKLDRAPTLVAVTQVRNAEGPTADEEDLCATACAAYAILLGAHARGLAGYWRTPGVLRTPAGRTALKIPDNERFVALIHLGRGRGEKAAPDRAPPQDIVIRLD